MANKKGYYNSHLRKTSDATPVLRGKIERGQMIKFRYKTKDGDLKRYMVFVLQPKWPRVADSKAKLHGLSLDNLSLTASLEMARLNDEVVSTASKVKKLDLAKIQINENSKAFYTSEIKSDPDLREAYRTFDLLKLKSIEVVNYNYGNFDKVDTREKRRKLEADAAERKRNDEGNNLTN